MGKGVEYYFCNSNHSYLNSMIVKTFVDVLDVNRAKVSNIIKIPMKMDGSLEQLEQHMVLKINKGYGVLVKTINESLRIILQLTITTAEQLEESLSVEINKIKIEGSNEASRQEEPKNKKDSLETSMIMKMLKAENGESELESLIYEDQNTLRKLGTPQEKEKIETKMDHWKSRTEYLTSGDVNVDQDMGNDTELPGCSSAGPKQEVPNKYIPVSMSMVKVNKTSVDKSPNFECEKCSGVFSQDANLQRHIMAKHSTVREFKCTECKYETYRKDKLALH